MSVQNDSSLTHVNALYDPIKAHEYYLRTRQLKGRKKSDTFTVSLAGHKTVTLTAKQLNEQKAYADKRVGEIRQKLSDLNSKLREAMSKAQKKKATSKRDASKPPSAADKSKAARESRQYRDKHKGKLATAKKRSTPDKKQSHSPDPVLELEHQIGRIRVSLKAAVAKQRALAGATRNG